MTAESMYYDEGRVRSDTLTYIEGPSTLGAEYDLHDATCEACEAAIAWTWHSTDESDYQTFIAYWETGEESGICEDCYNDWQARCD